jgi:hypothetical protein
MDTPDYLRQRLTAYAQERKAAAQAAERRADEFARNRALRVEQNRIARRRVQETARFLARALTEHNVDAPTIAIAQSGGFLRKPRPLLSGWSVAPEYARAKDEMIESVTGDDNNPFVPDIIVSVAPAESSYASGIVLGQDGIAHAYKIAPVAQRRGNRLVIPHSQQTAQLDRNGNLGYQIECMPDKARDRILTPQVLLNGLVQLADVYFQPDAQGMLVPRPEPLRPA